MNRLMAAVALFAAGIGANSALAHYSDGSIALDSSPVAPIASTAQLLPEVDQVAAANAAVSAGNAAYARSDYASALAQFARACDGGNAFACGALGGMYIDGEGVSANGARAAGPLAKACDAGVAAACGRLGMLYNNGNGVASKKAMAFKLLSGACSQSHMESCYNLGRLYESGQGIAQNLAQAAALYQKACAAKIADACSNLATFYANGFHFAQNEVQAIAFYKLACANGGQAGCKLYALLIADRNRIDEYTQTIESANAQVSRPDNTDRDFKACVKEAVSNNSYSKPSGCQSLGYGVCDNPLQSYNTTIYTSSFYLENTCNFFVEVTFRKNDGKVDFIGLKAGEISTSSKFRDLFGGKYYEEIISVTRDAIRLRQMMEEDNQKMRKLNKLHAQCLAGSDQACDSYDKTR